jgi:hypothetical protein
LPFVASIAPRAAAHRAYEAARHAWARSGQPLVTRIEPLVVVSRSVRDRSSPVSGRSSLRCRRSSRTCDRPSSRVVSACDVTATAYPPKAAARQRITPFVGSSTPYAPLRIRALRFRRTLRVRVSVRTVTRVCDAIRAYGDGSHAERGRVVVRFASLAL